MSEPAIQVKRHHKGSQVWAMDKFENKIIDMRDMYEERKERGQLLVDGATSDVFSEHRILVVRDGVVVCLCVCMILLFWFF